ncbi:MAG: NUDIX domain-containing protein [Paracoccaceae bacterium]
MKSCPVLLRWAGLQRQILVFRHPSAGPQLVKGTVEAGESAEAAARRELGEEAGIGDAVLVRALGDSTDIVPGEIWSFHLLSRSDLPDRWRHDPTGDRGGTYEFHWHLLEDADAAGFDPRYRRALAFIRKRLAEHGLC